MNPRNVKMYNNYGLELKAAGRIKEAEKNYLVSRESSAEIASANYIKIMEFCHK